MKLFKTTLFLALVSLQASAMDWTGRFEIRSTSTATTGCGTTAACTTASQTLYGLGVTTNIALGSDFGFFTGGVFRQRGVSYTLLNNFAGTSTVNMTYLDIPLLIQYTMGSHAIRLGVDVGLKASSSYSLGGGAVTTGFTDNSTVTPIEVSYDYSFSKDWLINLIYETGVPLANSSLTTAGNLADSNVIALGLGYNF